MGDPENQALRLNLSSRSQGTPKPAPHNPSQGQVEIWGQSESCLTPSFSAGIICQLGGSLKSLKNFGSPRSAPKPKGSQENLTAPPRALRVMGKWSVSGARPRGVGLKSEAPSAQSPNSNRDQAGGRRGQRQGGRSPRRPGNGLEAVGGSPHGCSAGGRSAHGLGAPGAPLARGSEIQRWL